MNSRTIITTLSIAIIVTGATCVYLFRDTPHKDSVQSSTADNNSKQYDSVSTRSPNNKSAKSKRTHTLPDGSSVTLHGSQSLDGAININQMNDLMCNVAIKQMAKYIEISEDEEKALHTLLKKHSTGNANIQIIAPGMDGLDAKTHELVSQALEIATPNLGGSNAWYNNQDFLLEAPSVIGKEKGHKLMEKANKLDYLDRDTQATQKMNNVQRETDLTDEEAKSLKQLYFEHPNPSVEQLNQVLPESKAQRAKRANPANFQFQIIEP